MVVSGPFPFDTTTSGWRISLWRWVWPFQLCLDGSEVALSTPGEHPRRASQQSFYRGSTTLRSSPPHRVRLTAGGRGALPPPSEAERTKLQLNSRGENRAKRLKADYSSSWRLIRHRCKSPGFCHAARWERGLRRQVRLIQLKPKSWKDSRPLCLSVPPPGLTVRQRLEAHLPAVLAVAGHGAGSDLHHVHHAGS